MMRRRIVDFAKNYFDEIALRIVAESGKTSDRFHLGKLILQSLKDAPDFVLQIDGATGKSETFRTVLEKTVQCAISLRKLGLKRGDVIVLMAPNHLDICVPMYAALYLGVAVSTIDRTLGAYELQGIFKESKPQVVFCQREKMKDVKTAVKENNLGTTVITFDKSENSYSDFIKNYYDNSNIDDFMPTDFDTSEVFSFFISTSGSTGLPKSAALTHSQIACTISYWFSMYENFPTPTRLNLVVSPLQWATAIYMFLLSVILRFTRLQSSAATSVEHIHDVINKYRPTYALMNPPFLTSLVKSPNRDQCDFTSFEIIIVAGSVAPPDLFEEFQKVSPKTNILVGYGMSEIGLTHVNTNYKKPMSALVLPCVKYRLIDTKTGKDVIELDTPGELWMTGPSVFTGYQNNAEATNEVFAPDGWLRTGDLFVRDENFNFTYVERIKMLLKYRNNQVSPVQIEGVIRRNPAVEDVAVTGIPDPEIGDYVVACVVRRQGYDVTAQEIKDLVKDSLSDASQLRGGVVFMDALPLIPSLKIDRAKLKKIVPTLTRL